jgi:hypothetical protein
MVSSHLHTVSFVIYDDSGKITLAGQCDYVDVDAMIRQGHNVLFTDDLVNPLDKKVNTANFTIVDV